jgi:hypothetical protein
MLNPLEATGVPWVRLDACGRDDRQIDAIDALPMVGPAAVARRRAVSVTSASRASGGWVLFAS